jgi:hypothetical protein
MKLPRLVLPDNLHAMNWITPEKVRVDHVPRPVACGRWRFNDSTIQRVVARGPIAAGATAIKTGDAFEVIIRPILISQEADGEQESPVHIFSRISRISRF